MALEVEGFVSTMMDLEFCLSGFDPVKDLKRIAEDDSQKKWINRAVKTIEDQRKIDKKRIASLETALRTVKRLTVNDVEVNSVIDNALGV